MTREFRLTPTEIRWLDLEKIPQHAEALRAKIERGVQANRIKYARAKRAERIMAAAARMMNNFWLHLPGQKYRTDEEFEGKRHEFKLVHEKLDAAIKKARFSVHNWTKELDEHPDMEDGAAFQEEWAAKGLSLEQIMRRMRRSGLMPKKGKILPVYFTHFKIWPLFVEALKHCDDHIGLSR